MAGNRLIVTHDGGYEFLTHATDVLSMLPQSTCDANKDYVALLVDCWVSLLADSPLHPELPAGGKPAKVFRKFHKWLLSQPLATVIAEYSSLADELTRTGTLYGEGSSTGTFIAGFRDTPVMSEYLAYFRDGDARCLQFLLSFLWFGKKAEIVDSELEPDALRKWLMVEQRLQSLELDQSIVADLALLLRLLLPPLPKLPFMGRHGPGTVAGGGRSPSLKMKQVTYDPLIDRAYFLSEGHKAYQERLAHDPRDVIPLWEKWIDGRSAHKQRRLRPSELLFVPKTTTSMRSICREPAVLMYFQQALRYELEESICQGLLGRFIDLKSQKHNQDACIAGSAGGLIDTIDLSSASDSVSLDLVKSIFPRHILIRMLATRSKEVKYFDETGEHIIQVRKFAPMGSAVCFPTQCIIYTVVGLRSMLRRALGPEWAAQITSRSELDRILRKIMFDLPKFDVNRMQPLRVFGDDILCDFRVTEDIINTLTTLGFTVNREKSFTGSSAFRESCGVFAWNGEDVTPLRFKVQHFERRLSPKSAASLVDLANRAGDFGYINLRRCVIHRVLEMPIEGLERIRGEKRGVRPLNPIRFTTDPNQFGIYTCQARNSHLRTRLYVGQNDETSCSMLQRDEVRCIQILDRYTQDQSYLRQRQEYIGWCRAAYHGVDSSGENRASWSDKIVRGAGLRWVWTPA